MKLSLILSVFDRHYIVSLGSEVQHPETEEVEHHDLTVYHERSSIGFQPNDGEWEDDNE